MTKDDIVKAAFRVWGCDFYRKPSLSKLAKELKVSKPALYRHFMNKNALNQAMINHFYDDFASFIRLSFEKAVQMDDADESLFTILQAIGSYFGHNRYAFIFSLVNVYDRKLDHTKASEQLKTRGVDLNIIRLILEKKYNIYDKLMQLIFATLTFYMAHFHKENDSLKIPPSDEKIDKVIDTIKKIVKQGLEFPKEKIDTINFDGLEKLINEKNTGERPEKQHPMPALIKAVAEAVAEAGPWEASMEMVAKKMGLSKSSLYGHFKNKKDMLRCLFITEFKHIIDFAQQGINLSAETTEQLYLGIYSIAVYLNSKPEILIAIDWIRTRKLDFGSPRTKSTGTKSTGTKGMEVNNLFEGIKYDSVTSHRILFLLINVLMNTENKGITNIRILYRFITLGLGGFIK